MTQLAAFACTFHQPTSTYVQYMVVSSHGCAISTWFSIYFVRKSVSCCNGNGEWCSALCWMILMMTSSSNT